MNHNQLTDVHTYLPTWQKNQSLQLLGLNGIPNYISFGSPYSSPSDSNAAKQCCREHQGYGITWQIGWIVDIPLELIKLITSSLVILTCTRCPPFNMMGRVVFPIPREPKWKRPFKELSRLTRRRCPRWFGMETEREVENTNPKICLGKISLVQGDDQELNLTTWR